MYKCLIVDDEELARNLIRNHLSQFDEFEIVAACESALDASKVMQQHEIDLLFLDIEMPVLRGTDFFTSLINKPKVIFTTASRNYALEGFELNAVDYLLKPITFKRFFNAIEKFLLLQQHTANATSKVANDTKSDFIFINKDRKKVKLLFDDIVYVESDKDYIKIHLLDKKHMIKHSISGFYELLDKRFLRVHRSYIINVDKITAYSKNDIEIERTEIPIGESYKSQVLDQLDQQT